MQGITIRKFPEFSQTFFSEMVHYMASRAITDQSAFLRLHSGCQKKPRISLSNSSSLCETKEKFSIKVGKSVLEKIWHRKRFSSVFTTNSTTWID